MILYFKMSSKVYLCLKFIDLLTKSSGMRKCTCVPSLYNQAYSRRESPQNKATRQKNISQDMREICLSVFMLYVTVNNFTVMLG